MLVHAGVEGWRSAGLVLLAKLWLAWLPAWLVVLAEDRMGCGAGWRPAGLMMKA